MVINPKKDIEKKTISPDDDYSHHNSEGLGTYVMEGFPDFFIPLCTSRKIFYK